MDLELCVATRHLVADDVIELTFVRPDGGTLPRWEPGAHIDVELDEMVRQYSLTGLRPAPDRWSVAILREPDSRGGSRYAHAHLEQGTAVRVSLPRNHFELSATAREVLFVAGGIGITPLLPMIERLESEGASWTLFYCGRSRSSMAYVDDLAKFGDRVRIRPDDEYGIPDLKALIAASGTDTVVYSCGPEGLLSALETCCSDPEHPRTLRVERFVPREIGADVSDTEFEVEFAGSGVTVTVPIGKSILSVAEEAGVEILSSCAEGTCGTCETPVLEGTPDHRDSVLTADERAGGETMMPCVSRALSARLVLDA